MKATRLDEKQVHKTPRCIAIWPHLVEPNTKFNPGGIYDIRIKITNRKDEKDFLSKMTELQDRAYQWNCQSQSKPSLPQEAAPWKCNDEGLWEFKFKSKASGVFEGKAWTNPAPKIFDSKGEIIADTSQLKIGNGSEVRVFFQVRPYYVQKAGIALRLKAVQVIKLVTFDSAASLGVEPEEDGEFVATPGTLTELQQIPPKYIMETPQMSEKDALVDALQRSVESISMDRKPKSRFTADDEVPF